MKGKEDELELSMLSPELRGSADSPDEVITAGGCVGCKV